MRLATGSGISRAPLAASCPTAVPKSGRVRLAELAGPGGPALSSALNGHSRLDALHQLFTTGPWLPPRYAGGT